jgi:hypothetical protein
VTTLPTSPFPELRPLEEKRKVPSLAELLSGGEAFPIDPAPVPAPPARPALKIHRMPRNGEAASAKAGPSAILADMPVAPFTPTFPGAIAELMVEDSDPLPELPAPGAAPPPSGPPKMAAPEPAADPSPEASRPQSQSPASGSSGRGNYWSERGTDEDLKEAFLPMLETTLSKALYAPETGLHTYLEPMLRSTVRRAIAEQLESSRQFGEIGALDRLAWRLSALFTSRTYDEIVFDRTHRYQVEEVYLLRKKSRTLISYASHDPARHASPRRVQSTVRMLVAKLKGAGEDGSLSFDLPERRVALVRSGNHTLLVAILRGSSNALVRADLDYIQRQAEERFGSRLAEDGEAFIRVLQPILEGCLLIQAPTPPR